MLGISFLHSGETVFGDVLLARGNGGVVALDAGFESALAARQRVISFNERQRNLVRESMYGPVEEEAVMPADDDVEEKEKEAMTVVPPVSQRKHAQAHNGPVRMPAISPTSTTSDEREKEMQEQKQKQKKKAHDEGSASDLQLEDVQYFSPRANAFPVNDMAMTMPEWGTRPMATAASIPSAYEPPDVRDSSKTPQGARHEQLMMRRAKSMQALGEDNEGMRLASRESGALRPFSTASLRSHLTGFSASPRDDGALSPEKVSKSFWNASERVSEHIAEKGGVRENRRDLLWSHVQVCA